MIKCTTTLVNSFKIWCDKLVFLFNDMKQDRYYFFQAKRGYWNFYTNIYEYLKPDLKNLMSGLSESVEKCTKS